MIYATRQANGFSRVIPLNDAQEYQTCRQITPDDVPPLSATAKLVGVSTYTYRYQDGRHEWYVDRFDKAKTRAYREHRDQKDIEAGAFPTAVRYDDGKGPL